MQKKAFQKLSTAKKCRKSKNTRRLYKNQHAKLKNYAQEIKQQQENFLQIEKEHERDLKKIKNSCNIYLNPLKGTIHKYINPVAYFYYEAKNHLAPKKSNISMFNKCVERKTKGKEKLRQALTKESIGWLTKIYGEFKSLSCYNEQIRKKLQCEVVLGFMTGVPSLSKYALKRLGPNLKKHSKIKTKLQLLNETKIVGIKSCKPNDCDVKKILITKESIEHSGAHVFNSKKIHAVTDSFENTRKELINTYSQSSNKKKKNFLKSRFSKYPFRTKVTSIFPPNTKPEDIIKNSKDLKLTRTHK